MVNSINIQFPFKDGFEDGVFGVNSTTEKAMRSDLISLLTTKRGQRIMNSELYSPIFDYIHEPLDETTQGMLENDIKKKVGQFIPQISITKINFLSKPEENLLNMTIVFSTNNTGISQKVELNVPTEFDNVDSLVK